MLAAIQSKTFSLLVCCLRGSIWSAGSGLKCSLLSAVSKVASSLGVATSSLMSLHSILCLVGHWLWNCRVMLVLRVWDVEETVPGWPPHGVEITYRSSGCPENNGADWRSWEGGSPEDGLLILPEVGNPRWTPCNQGRWQPWVLGRRNSPGWWWPYLYTLPVGGPWTNGHWRWHGPRWLVSA